MALQCNAQQVLYGNPLTNYSASFMSEIAFWQPPKAPPSSFGSNIYDLFSRFYAVVGHFRRENGCVRAEDALELMGDSVWVDDDDVVERLFVLLMMGCHVWVWLHRVGCFELVLNGRLFQIWRRFAHVEHVQWSHNDALQCAVVESWLIFRWFDNGFASWVFFLFFFGQLIMNAQMLCV